MKAASMIAEENGISDMTLDEINAEIAERGNDTFLKIYAVIDTNVIVSVINNEHKDRLFKFLFSNPENRMWTLNLYNAINDSNYDDEEAVYLGMKNDVLFIITSELNLWEHQSTYNPNMPMRFFYLCGKII